MNPTTIIIIHLAVLYGAEGRVLLSLGRLKCYFTSHGAKLQLGGMGASGLSQKGQDFKERVVRKLKMRYRKALTRTYRIDILDFLTPCTLLTLL
jgi:hypothetical protein